MIVTMTDGSTVAGFFGEGSCASEDLDERDVYISQVYEVADDGVWKRRGRSEGILIRGEYIRHIEFFNDMKEQDNAQQ